MEQLTQKEIMDLHHTNIANAINVLRGKGVAEEKLLDKMILDFMLLLATEGISITLTKAAKEEGVQKYPLENAADAVRDCIIRHKLDKLRFYGYDVM